MKPLHLLSLGAAVTALLVTAPPVEAQHRPMTGIGYGQLPPHYGQLPPRYGQLPPRYGQLPVRGGHRHERRLGRHGGFVGFPGVYVVEREVVVVEREVVVEVPAPAPEPPPPPREPHVIGKSYASLPGGCMKMIENGASYYLCSGEWYRQMGSGSGVTYRAVKAP